MVPNTSALVWFRRDLRATDHAALHAALRAHRQVHCVFVFDTEILDALPTRADRRVEFIWRSVRELRTALEARGGGLHVLHARAREAVPALAQQLRVAAVYANRDYEPAAIDRDAEVAARLAAADIAFHTRKDQVIFERGELRTKAGGDFSVFTPYRRAWLARLAPFFVRAYPIDSSVGMLVPAHGNPLPPLEALGFTPTRADAPGLAAGASGAAQLFADFRRRIDTYAEQRDRPALDGPSYLSVHLRFGTVSIRALVAHAWTRRGDGAATWLSELIWREFYFSILAARPDVIAHAFRREYDALVWDDDDAHWKAWCAGRTGYPIVDAAMRQLNTSGYMHNRLRMIAASFLVKDLGIDWRRGERYFADQLNDFDLAANNGGWQWVASTGCDAQPWFRIFNPVTQSRRFDPGGSFIRRYVPELARVPDDTIHSPWLLGADAQARYGCVLGRDYPAPLVDHAAARTRTRARYAAVRGER